MFINGTSFVNQFVNGHVTGFPLGLENLKKWEGISQSGNFKQKILETNTGKLREFQTKVREFRQAGKVGAMCYRKTCSRAVTPP